MYCYCWRDGDAEAKGPATVNKMISNKIAPTILSRNVVVLH